jgi:hypothetical protein
MTSRVSIAAALLLTLTSCVSTPKVATPDCQPTVAHMTPAREAFDFFFNHSSSTRPDKRSIFEQLNWYGNEAMWVTLPPNGEIVGSLGDKIPPYRLKYGQVWWEARRLDGPGVVAKRSMGPADIGFQPGGVGVPETGCWEFTYTLDDQYPLTFTLRVR